MRNKITAIIITYNPEVDLLIQQFNSLINQVDEIIYVDNNSSNQFRDKLGSSKVRFISNNENLGLGKAQNQGILLAFSEGASHVVLFDQDSIADTNLIKELVKVESEYKKNQIKVALVGPAIYNNYNSPPTVSEGIKKLGWSIQKQPLAESILEVEYCIASGSLISKEVFDSVGYINETLFIDALDLEWCQRAKYKGYIILQNPRAKIFHQLGNGSNDNILSHSTMREFYICRNNILLIKMRHIPLGYRIRKAILTPLRPIKALMKFRLNYFFAGIKGILKGI